MDAKKVGTDSDVLRVPGSFKESSLMSVLQFGVDWEIGRFKDGTAHSSSVP